jgi:hypothetical protein
MVESRRTAKGAAWGGSRGGLVFRGLARGRCHPDDGAQYGHAKRGARHLARGRPRHEQLADGGDDEAQATDHGQQDTEGVHVQG